MEVIFNIVLITSLYGSIVGLSLIFIKNILRNRLSPQWHYIIWTVLVLKLLIPFGPESVVSLFNIIPDVYHNYRIDNSSNNYSSNHSDVYSIDNSYEIQNKSSIPLKKEKVLDPVLHNMPIVQNSVNSTTISWENVKSNTKNILPFIWLMGALITLLWILLTYFTFCLKLQKEKHDIDVRIINILEECKKRIGVKRKLHIKISRAISTPALFGVINPKIILAPEFTNLKDKEIEYVLLHELAHYKRKDTVANYLLIALQVVHWFNPVMWYCFKRIRLDMEVATDQRVLSVLENNEHKEYGKILIEILESFSRSISVPRLLGVVDDKKSIERRIKMIKMFQLFKRKRNISIAIGVFCVVILGGVFLTSGMSPKINDLENVKDSGKNKVTENIKDTGKVKSSSLYNADELYKHRSKYIGDASNVGNLLRKLPLGNFTGGLELHTESQPYGLTVAYSFEKSNMDLQQIKSILNNNVLILFTLIENLDNVNFKYTDSQGGLGYSYSRNECQKSFDIDFWDNSKDIDSFERFLENLSLNEPVTANEIENKEAQIQKPKSLDEAISLAIKGEAKLYRPGECITEGHIILDREEKDGVVTAYTISSLGCYGFENGIFTKVSGSGANPIVITFSVDNKGEYTLVKYKRPMDGADYLESIKKMFPKELHGKVLSAHDKYSELLRQQEEQAKKYLISIGRKASVTSNHLREHGIDIDIEAMDMLFGLYNKCDSLINTCPDGIGSRERIENGVRYIYETLQTKTIDGYDLIVFKKSKDDGTLVEEKKYKIDGSEVELYDFTSEGEKRVSLSKEDKVKALDVITKYFHAFAQTDYEKMKTFSTGRHNGEYVNAGDVWGMKWAMSREINMIGNPDFLRIDNDNPTIVFGVSVFMETVTTSALYPSKETFFYVVMKKGEDGTWKVDQYTTG